MKKLFLSLIILIITYFIIKWSLVYFSTEHEIKYIINKEDIKFEISETFKNKQNNDRTNYYLKINYNDVIFSYQVFEDLKKQNKIIKDIIYYEDEEYKCILPIFDNNKFLFDINCYDGKVFNYYNNINSPNDELKKFVSGLSNYDFNNWQESSKILEKKDNIIVYDNMISNHYIGMSSYKGVVSVNDKNIFKEISVFNQDFYQRTISTFVDNYYITADYTGINNFNEFEMVDLNNNEIFKIFSKYKISYNSYILGISNKLLYLYDKDNRVEYEIDLENKQVSVVGKKDKYLKFYSNENWINLRIEDFTNNKVFDSKYISDYSNDEYIHIDKIGNEVGYYYLFKQVNNKYQVYRINIQDKNNLTYLFTTTDYNNLIYLDDYIYYLDGNNLRYYSDKTGNKTVVKNTEFEFNKTIKFSVYEKK